MADGSRRRAALAPNPAPFGVPDSLYKSSAGLVLPPLSTLAFSPARLALRAFAGVAICEERTSAAGLLDLTPSSTAGSFISQKSLPLIATTHCQGAEALSSRAGTTGAAQLSHSTAHSHVAAAHADLAAHHLNNPHDQPPQNTLGFAEDAGAHAPAVEEQVKAAPRLTVASVIKSLIAGGVAGAVSRTAVAPLERLKILQQVQNSGRGGAAPYKGMWQGLRLIYAREGLNGLFKGNGVNCARIVPNSAVKFFAYEEASHLLLWSLKERTGNKDAELTPLLRLGAGATAGIIAMSATYPMDMVRGRLTVQGDGASRQYKNMGHAMTTVWREEGFTALYRGWLPSVIGVVPYVGLNFAVYETLKDWMTKHYTQQERQERLESLSAQAGGQEVDASQVALGPAVELSVVAKLGCGAVAGTMGQTVAYPLDVVRRRLQMVGWKNAAPVLTAEGAVAHAPQYTGMVDAFRKTVQQEGVQALFRGLLPNSVKVVPSIAIAFVTYELMKDLLGVEIRISD